MEKLVDQNLFSGIYAGKKVFLTGHTGFKGSWLAYWLSEMGAEVCGYSLAMTTEDNHFDHIQGNVKSIIGDIRDKGLLNKSLADFAPDIVFHLAAQPLVRLSYEEPHETFSTNILGSLNVYEAAKSCDSVRAIVSITTDKVYDNKEWVWGYRESDSLGGKDPYSASKAAMEIMTSSYQHSFLNTDTYGKDHQILLATARAGNVIGGGDWARDRLIPDIIKSSLANSPVNIRSPYAVRPWQHVLEPLSGYLMLGEQLLKGDKSFANAFNFGPPLTEEVTVEDVVKIIKKNWPAIDYVITRPDVKLYESTLLKLDCTKAMTKLRWKPTWETQEGIERTVKWYQSFYDNKEIATSKDLSHYVNSAKKRDLAWATNNA